MAPLGTLFTLAVSSLVALSNAHATSNNHASSACCRGYAKDGSHQETILSNYLAIWGGDLSLMDTTFHPDVALSSDRFPSSSGNGSDLTVVTNRTQFTAFVEKSRNGWESYTFDPIHSLYDDSSIAVRWKMNGVLGANFTLFPTPLKAGSSVTYNGTDLLILDECTGLIIHDYIAQDLISYFHAMGLTAITV
ncbi:uncharacterized protein N7496_009056 [Penicillium cataractarum]|uniref:SnoaL-like domain-containing protein n=1 Tax=Penicillium cataractarum TaxID=2100454 RepID=A0A9W9V7M4_9EURO|nr:uncharacterized protein N7496_009056 [Penicillium cataractarum]KAJ5369296.1 hypothetical protein N7496_009056 [Penicillium cataractarum]